MKNTSSRKRIVPCSPFLLLPVRPFSVSAFWSGHRNSWGLIHELFKNQTAQALTPSEWTLDLALEQDSGFNLLATDSWRGESFPQGKQQWNASWRAQDSSCLLTSMEIVPYFYNHSRSASIYSAQTKVWMVVVVVSVFQRLFWDGLPATQLFHSNYFHPKSCFLSVGKKRARLARSLRSTRGCPHQPPCAWQPPAPSPLIPSSEEVCRVAVYCHVSLLKWQLQSCFLDNFQDANCHLLISCKHCTLHMWLIRKLWTVLKERVCLRVCVRAHFITVVNLNHRRCLLTKPY